MENAYFCKDTGQIFYTLEMGDSDELPEDIEAPKYISFPHKNDLDLGKNLVVAFVSEFLLNDLDRFTQFFGVAAHIHDIIFI